MRIPWFFAEFAKASPLIGVLCLSVAAPAAIALGQPQSKAGEPVVVIAPPWQAALALAASAGGRFVAPGRMQSIALVWSADPNFTQELYAKGAWLVLSASLSGMLCNVE